MTLHNFSSDIPAQALEHFDRGMELLDEGDPREAAAEFLRAIRYDSSVIYQEAELMLATAYRLASDSEDERDLAIKQYQKVTTLDPDDGGSWLWLALLAISNSFKDGKLRPGEKAQYYSEQLHPEAIQRAKETFPKLVYQKTLHTHLKVRNAVAAATGYADAFSMAKDKASVLREALYWYEAVARMDLPDTDYLQKEKDKAVRRATALRDEIEQLENLSKQEVNSATETNKGSTILYDEQVSEEAFQHLQTGLELYEQENFRGAAGEFLLGIRANEPNAFVTAERLLATCYREIAFRTNSMADLDQAIKQYREVTSLDPNDAGSWLWLHIIIGMLVIQHVESLSEDAREKFDSKTTTFYMDKVYPQAASKAKENFAKLDSYQKDPLKKRFALLAAIRWADSLEESQEISDLRDAIFYYQQVENADVEATGLSEEIKKDAARGVARIERRLTSLEKDEQKQSRQRKNKILIGVIILVFLCGACLCLLGFPFG